MYTKLCVGLCSFLALASKPYELTILASKVVVASDTI